MVPPLLEFQKTGNMNTTIRSSVYFVLFFFVSIAVNAQASQDSTILEKKGPEDETSGKT